MLTESLMVVCIHLLPSAVQFKVDFPLLLSTSPPSFHPLLLLPNSLSVPSSSLPASYRPSLPQHLHHTHASPLYPSAPACVLPPGVRDQSGEGVMSGWRWEPSGWGATHTVSYPKEREKERDNTQLPSRVNQRHSPTAACTLSHEQHLSGRTRLEAEKKRDSKTSTHIYTASFPP